MRKNTLTILVLFLSATMASGVLLLVYQDSLEARPPSQGVLGKGPKLPEENFKAYSETVDNTSGKAFRAPGWQTTSKGNDIHGQDYTVVGKGKSTARYRFDIPARDTYTVFAWWPTSAGAASSVRIKVRTGIKAKTETVDQSKDGGYWVPIGKYEMRKGERYAVEISGRSGKNGKPVADAVAIVRGIESFPADPKEIGSDSEIDTSSAAASEETMVSAAASSRPIPRRALMRRAKSYLGTPYDYNYSRCRAGMARLDCSCLTRLVYMKWRKIPDSPRYQWYRVKNLSSKFKRKRHLRRGDLTFFDENRNGVMNHHDSVAIYAGNGRVIMASGYFGKVTVVEMKYIYGFFGGKRLRY